MLPGYPLIPQVKKDVCTFVPPTNKSSSNDGAKYGVKTITSRRFHLSERLVSSSLLRVPASVNVPGTSFRTVGIDNLGTPCETASVISTFGMWQQ